MLRCSDRSLYTGIAKDLPRRIAEHSEGRGSKYVRSRLPVKLVYSEKLKDKSRALKREAELKCWTRPEKLALITKKEAVHGK